MKPFALYVLVTSLSLLTPAVAVAAESHVQETFPGEGRDNSYTFSAGFGLAMLDGEIGWGLNAGAAKEVTVGFPFYVGLDLGLHFWNRRNQRDPLGSLPEPVSSGMVSSLQVLPTFYYQFLHPVFPGAVPYLGLSAGPSFYLPHGTTPSGGETNKVEIYPTILVRPGLHVILTEDAGMMIEPKMGILKSELIFVPQLSAIWLL